MRVSNRAHARRSPRVDVRNFYAWKEGAPYPAALALLWPSQLSDAGVQASAVGPAPTWSYTGDQYDDSGVSVGTVPALHGDKGVWCGPGYTNLFAGDPSIARSVTLTAQTYTLWCSSGSVSCSYGTATPSAPLTFVATAGAATFTPTGVTQWQLTATVAPMPYVLPGTTVASAAGTSGGNGLGFDMALEPDGVELVYNGGFDTSVDGWNKNASAVMTWEATGKLSLTRVVNGDDVAFQAVSCIVGAKYRVTASVNAGTGTAMVLVGTSATNGTAYAQPNTGVAESWTFDFTATATTHFVSLSISNATTRLFDNISVQRLTSPLMQCFEKPETDGVELVTNGGFDSDVSGWISGSANTTLGWVGGEASATLTVSSTADASLLCQLKTLVNGGLYRVSFDAYSPTYRGTLRVDNESVGGASSAAAVSVGRSVAAQKQRYTAVLRADSTNTIRIIGGVVAVVPGDIIYFDNISVQKLKPATCTVAAEVTMGASSYDYPLSGYTRVLNITNSDTFQVLACGKSASGASLYPVIGSDGTTTKSSVGPWSRNERHLKIVQTNALGTQFRVGNLRRGIDSAIQWSAWTNYDGSFNPLTHLRLAFGSTAPIWIKGVQVWDKGQVSESEILRQFKTVGVK